MITILLIAVGLAMDAFAVSISSGVTIKRLRISYAFTIAALFGGFQAVMPGIGWLAGHGLKSLIAGVDHWIAFGLLTAVGCKMIYESPKMGSTGNGSLDIVVLLVLSVATSIDALAVGLSLSMLGISVLVAAIVIGLVTFVLSFCGVYIGKRFGHVFENKIQIVGGLILIGIGTKILVEHLS